MRRRSVSRRSAHASMPTVWPRQTQKYAKKLNISTNRIVCTNGPRIGPLCTATPMNSVNNQIASTSIASYEHRTETTQQTGGTR